MVASLCQVTKRKRVSFKRPSNKAMWRREAHLGSNFEHIWRAAKRLRTSTTTRWQLALGRRIRKKNAFRLEWAKWQLEGITTETKSSLESWQQINEEVGTYEPFDMVLKHEGGRWSPAAWAAAMEYCKTCCALGGRWLSYNYFTKRVDVLYIKKTQRSVHKKCWDLYKQTVSTENQGAASASANDSTNPSASAIAISAAPENAGGTPNKTTEATAKKRAAPKKRVHADGVVGSPADPKKKKSRVSQTKNTLCL